MSSRISLTAAIALLLLFSTALSASPQPAEGRVDVPGGSVYYRSFGAGPPVILLHGYMNSGAVWGENFANLANQHRMIAFDLPGHGRSDKLSDTFTHQASAASLLEAVEALGISSFHIIGHSSGALIGLYMALQQPDKVQSIVTIATPWRVPETLRQMAGQLSVETASPAMLETLQAWHPGGSEQISWLLQQQRRMAADPAEMSLAPEQLRQVSAQALVVHGDRDSLLPVGDALELATLLPQSSLFVIPGGQHELTLQTDALRLLAAAVAEFLGNQAPDSSSKEVAYSSGDVMLAGTLMVPSGNGPFPAVAIIHGSGSSDRSNAWTAAYAAALVERGIVVLHPDKRGSGESGGNWSEASFLDLADDAVAALHLLQDEVSVDSTRVGLIGFSQGGHVAPVAATRSSVARFVINVSGSVVPILDQIGDELRKMGQREGLSAEELNTVRSLHVHAVNYALDRENWAVYSVALEEAKGGTLGKTKVVDGFPTDPDSGAWEFLRTIGNFDPLPYWREVEVPTLFIYGGRDENVDVFKSTDIIEGSLTSAGLPYDLLLFGNNGHAIFREDAMDFMARWIHNGGTD